MFPKVSVIISNRNDVAMLAVTVRSCIEELRPLGANNSEIIIVDNSDPDAYSLVQSAIPSKYIHEGLIKLSHQSFPCLFTAREQAAEQASGTYIICVDSHMIIGHNCFLDLLNFMEELPIDYPIGFAHAPINWAHQHESHSKHDRDMSINELGDWGAQYSYNHLMTWKGIPWICRRSWFLDRENGLNGYGALRDHKVSWGGGDMLIGIKPWLLGFKNWAIPTSPCIHIGPFPKVDLKGVETIVTNGDDERYRRYAKSGNYPHAFGFLVACYVLGGEPMMHRNSAMITERFGRYLNVKQWWNKAIELGTAEHLWLSSRQIITFEELIKDKPWQLVVEKIA